MSLPYPHARNDCGACRERDADVQVLGEGRDRPGRCPLLLCQGCPGAHITVMAIQHGGPELDRPFTITVTVAPGRRRDRPAGSQETDR